MPIWLLLRRWATAQFNQLTGRNLLLVVAGYVAISWLLLFAAKESAMTSSFTDFVYYLLVTASTVGYGDLSPTTAIGKWIVSLFVIPGGLGLFAITIGRLAAIAINYWKSGLQGKRSLTVNGHILVLGWNEQRTLSLLEMLLHEEKNRRRIVLCVISDIENPYPDLIDFVKVRSYTDNTDMAKASVATANCIIIDNPKDDLTLSSALFCSSQNPNAHLLAYFNDEVLSDLLKQHCPNAECIPSVSVEMLTKAAVDPGSSELHHELLSSNKGMTQYKVIYPHTCEPITVAAIFESFKADYDATLIAINSGQGMELNPALDAKIPPGSQIFYIADERIDDFKWS